MSPFCIPKVVNIATKNKIRFNCKIIMPKINLNRDFFFVKMTARVRKYFFILNTIVHDTETNCIVYIDESQKLSHRFVRCLDYLH